MVPLCPSVDPMAFVAMASDGVPLAVPRRSYIGVNGSSFARYKPPLSSAGVGRRVRTLA